MRCAPLDYQGDRWCPPLHRAHLHRHAPELRHLGPSAPPPRPWASQVRHLRRV